MAIAYGATASHENVILTAAYVTITVMHSVRAHRRTTTDD